MAKGDSSLIGSEHIVQRINELISKKHILFDEIESGASSETQKKMRKMLHKRDIINLVFQDLEEDQGVHGLAKEHGFSYSPAQLRASEELPDEAPSQRPPKQDKETVLGAVQDLADLWEPSACEQVGIVLHIEDRTKEMEQRIQEMDDPDRVMDRHFLNLDDFWE